MCPHCGNGGCGVLSARLTRDATTVAWTVPGLHGIGPFTFHAAQYDSVLRPLPAPGESGG